MEHWTSVIRIVCLVGCLVALWMLASAKFREWKNWNSKTKAHWIALLGWVFFGLYITAESILMRNPGSSRLILLTLVVVLTVRALMNSNELRSQASVPWKGDNKK